MPQPAIVPSIASQRDAIGGRAARHLDLVFRELMVGRGAELGDGYLRLITGEPHPLGNVAIVTDAGSPATTQAAIGPLGSLALADVPRPTLAEVRRVGSDTMARWTFD